MPYIVRENGKIVGVLAWPAPTGESEFREEDHPEVQTFLQRAGRPARLRSLRDIMDVLSVDQQLAIIASEDAGVKLMLVRASAAPFNLDSEESQKALEYLVEKGLVTPKQREAILA